MALSKTHILCTITSLLRSDAMLHDINPEAIAYAVLPDAIRCFSFGGIKNTRVVSHFEVHPSTGVASAMKFPTPEELKVLTDDIVESKIVNIEDDYHQVAIGDTTNIGAYIQENRDLPEIEYKATLCHLLQDSLYDNYVRSLIDATGRYDGKFIYTITGAEYDAKSVRQLIADIEQQEFRYLASIFENMTDVKVEKYFEEVVFPAIRSAFCPKMAESTIKYINLSDSGLCVAPDDICANIVEDMIGASCRVWK